MLHTPEHPLSKKTSPAPSTRRKAASLKIVRDPSSIAITITSDFANVSKVAGAFREFLTEYRVQDPLGPLIVLRELLLNAIVYGNRQELERRVHCHLRRLVNGGFRMEVEDEGDGFDYRKIDMNLPQDPRRLQRRGYALIRALTDKLEFNRKGNRVVAHFRPAMAQNPARSHREDE